MKKISTHKMIAIGLLIAAIILSIVSWTILPDTVITQLSIKGSSPTTMPKSLAVLIPATFSGIFSICALVSKNDDKKNNKSLLISLIGIAVFIVMLIVNR